MLKPEVRRFLPELDDFLEKSEFKVSSRHPVSDWKSLCKDLYAPQLRRDRFRYEFNAYSWLSTNLFGNHSAVFLLDVDGMSVWESLSRLNELKMNFREYLKKYESPIQIFLDMERLPLEGAQTLGENNSVSIGRRKMSGKWEDFYFKHIHTSDPEPKVLHREMEVLKSSGIFGNYISLSEWGDMKRRGSLVYENSSKS